MAFKLLTLFFRLLFHLLASQIGCKNNDVLAVSQRICMSVYQEATFAIDNIESIPEIKDLFMEQVFLCSFVGFGEFWNDKWISKILQWQMDSGCFSYDNVTCSSHMNGLGAATLAFFGRRSMLNVPKN